MTQELEKRNPKKIDKPFRIVKSDGRIVNAGTGQPSWFSLEEARSKVNREEGERIFESNGVDFLWEVF